MMKMMSYTFLALAIATTHVAAFGMMGGGPGGMVNKVIMGRFLESCMGTEAASIIHKDTLDAATRCQSMTSAMMTQPEMAKAMEMASKFAVNPAKLAKIASMRTFFGNMTCKLQEMGMLTQELQPNFDGMKAKIEGLPLEESLRGDFFKSLRYCRTITECAEEEVDDEMSGFVPAKFLKTKTFFKCFMERKIMTCVKHDMKKRKAEHQFGDDSGADFPTPLASF